MKLAQILEQIPYSIVFGSEDTEVTEILTDSRKASAGSMFFALTGLGADGHNFIRSAVDQGASVIVAERIVPIDDAANVTYVLVDCTPIALSMAAQAFYGYPARKMRFVGVTGTNGKTTVTHLIKQILDFAGFKTGLIGTNHHLIGERELPSTNTTPEAHHLQRLFSQMAEEHVEIVVMEVSSHALALSRLAGVEFETGVFTNLTRDHLDFHETMEEYRSAKAILFSMCRKAVINMDDKEGTFMKKAAGKNKVFTYGMKKETDFVAEEIVYSSRAVRFKLREKNEITDILLGIPGTFSVYNGLAAIAACASLHLPTEKIAKALAVAKGVTGRAETVNLPLPYTVIIDYAHTPDGLENILNTVRAISAKRIITVFGCGGNRDKTKRPIMGEVVGKLSDIAIVTSDNPRLEEPEAIIADILPGMEEYKEKTVIVPDRRKAISYALSIAQTDDIILLAGKGHETYQDIGGTKIDFDERVIVREEAAMLGML